MAVRQRGRCFVVCVEVVMMGTRVFAEKGRVKLVGDERDIGIVSNYREDVWAWCDANNINLEYQGTLGKMDLWRVRDERQRVMFLLRWA